MDIWQMRYFIQIYKDKSLSKAARNLYISQQGLSKAIKSMEEELQLPLFDRSAKGVTPTVYGELLMENTQKIVNDYDRMLSNLYEKVPAFKKIVRIGIANILNTKYLRHVICSFQEKYPHITLELIELGSFSSEKSLEEDQVDICFVLKPDNTSYYDYIEISTYNLVLLVNKDNPISCKSSIDLSELKDEKFIMLSSAYKIRKLTNDFCIKAGFIPNIIFATSQLDFIIELIDLNKGLAILPEFNSVAAAKLSNRISLVHLNDPFFQIELGFIMKKHSKINTPTKTFIDYIYEHLRH